MITVGDTIRTANGRTVKYNGVRLVNRPGFGWCAMVLLSGSESKFDYDDSTWKSIPFGSEQTSSSTTRMVRLEEFMAALEQGTAKPDALEQDIAKEDATARELFLLRRLAKT
tara:strand:+ start:2620 stop:2955 length:336 start_codon:yes stop_codon:yes gene_type:complete